MSKVSISKLKEFIRETLKEIMDEMDEMTSTGSIQGFNVPHAFKKKKKNKKIDEHISPKDLKVIKKLIRSELSDVFKDLWAKRSTWGG
tara:strand:- start:72 stop:335 length:264 start_codon:yes stop_codon:yes gene_type:complete